MIDFLKNNHHPSTRLHFRRFEFKYLLTPTAAEKIKSYLAHFTVPDPFIAASGQRRYEVVSVYYDTPLFYYYYEKQDGVKERKKIRLRAYRNHGAFSPYVFFEIKRKDDVIVSKDRFVMPVEEYQILRQDNDFGRLPAEADANRRSLVREFEWEKSRRAIRPVLGVAYEREPYVGKFNPNLRITFDSNLRAAENDDVLCNSHSRADVLGPMTVMEIKFNGTLPFYIQRAVKIFNLQRVAYSKYCQSLERCGTTTFPARCGRNRINLLLA